MIEVIIGFCVLEICMGCVVGFGFFRNYLGRVKENFFFLKKIFRVFWGEVLGFGEREDIFGGNGFFFKSKKYKIL